MALIPLTGDRWSGLPLSLCANAAASRELDLEIATPLLVLWNADGPTIEVRQTATRRWTVARRANHFSLFASIEDMFALGGIAYANLPDLTRFDKTVYTAYNQPAAATGSRAERKHGR